MRALVSFLLLLPLALAVSPATITGEQTLPGAEVAVIEENAPVYGGYEYEVNLSFESLSRFWAALFGNIQKTYVLGTSSGIFFSWPAPATGYVLLTTHTDVNWNALDGGVTDHDINQDVYDVTGLSWEPGPDENVSATFSFVDDGTDDGVRGNQCWDADGDGNPDPDYPYSVDPAYTLTYSYPSGYSWITCLLKDPSGRVVYKGKIEEDKNAFNGEPADYQVLVAAVEGNSIVYYLYVD